MEDLRQHYITSLYLQTMARRARGWSIDFIQSQMTEFRRSIPGYPEVLDVLEGELHIRELNQLHARLKLMSTDELDLLIQDQNPDSDAAEIIRTERELRMMRGKNGR